jgi:hypothetical protein
MSGSCRVEIGFTFFDYRPSLVENDPFCVPSPADIPLNPALSFTPLPIKCSVITWSLTLVMRKPNAVVKRQYVIKFPILANFFQYMLYLLTTRTPSTFAAIYGQPG